MYLKMDWERVLAQGSILLTRAAAQQEKNFPLQSRSYHISLESIFDTDSKKHHNIYSKMDWERVLHQRSNLLTRPAALPKKKTFLFKIGHNIYRWKAFLIENQIKRF